MLEMWNLDYSDLYQLSIENPEKFWDSVAQEVVWTKPYTSVIEDKHTPSPKWFVGGELNVSYNCLDRQVEDGHGDEVAVIFDSRMTSTVQKLTYNELLWSVERLAGVLTQTCGVVKGDNVALYFSRIPHCLMAMLACARIGAVSVTIYAGSPVSELIGILHHTNPKVIITANVGLEPNAVINYKERVDKAIEESGCTATHCIVYNRPNYPIATLIEGRDLDWTSEVLSATPQGPVPLESSHPHYIIFTSGTTGTPKGIVRPTAGSVVTNMYSMKHLVNLKPGQVWWVMSDFSWTLGQSVMSYGPLMSRNPTIVFEGRILGTNDEAQILRVVNQHEVAAFFSIPTNMRHLHKFASEAELTLTSNKLKTVFLGGELSDVVLKDWVAKVFHCPVHEIWGQTEMGDFGILNDAGIKGIDKYSRPGFTGLIMPGFSPRIVDRNTGAVLPNGEVGRFILKLPMGPSMMQTIYKDHDRCIRTYYEKYPGYYDTMDAAIMMDNGALKIVSRDDDTIEVGSAGISIGALEETCLKVPGLVSVAVVAMEDEIMGFVPFAFLVPKIGIQYDEKELINKVFEAVLDCIGDWASFNNAVVIHALPRTRGGKIPRRSLAQMLNGQKCEVLKTIDNPEEYSTIYEALIRAGYKASKPVFH